MDDPLLSVANLIVERGGRLVLSDLSFTLDRGEAILVSGRNGTGKSTLLRTIAGLLQPVSGRIHFANATDEQRGVETAHYLGYEDALKPSLTVAENLAFWASMLGAPSPPVKRQRGTTEGGGAPPGPTLRIPPLSRSVGEDVTSQDALAALGVARLIDLPAGYLSAGQKRRVALARLLLAPRQIWLLDEPLIALDVEAQAALTAIMAGHLAAGGAILIASHQPLTLTCREIALGTQVAAL